MLAAGVAAGVLASVSVPGTPGALGLAVAVAVGYVAADRLPLRVERRDHVIAITLVELPLTFGLFCLSVPQLIVARLAAGAFVVAVLARVPAVKLVFSLGLFVLEVVTAVVVFDAVTLLGAGATSPWAWTGALAGCGASMLVVAAAISVAIRVATGQRAGVEPSEVAVMALASLSTGSVGTIAYALWATRPGLLVLLLLPGACMVAAYRAYVRSRGEHQSLRQLYDFTRLVGRTPELEGLVAATLRQARELLNGSHVDLIVLAGEGDADLWTRLDGDDALGAETHLAWRDDEVLAGVAAGREPRLGTVADERGRTSSTVAVPILVADQVAGLLRVVGQPGAPAPFGPDDATRLQTLANHAAIALENTRLIDRLRLEATEREHQALHDPLTGLGNRRMFTRELERRVRDARECGGELTVCLLDLNRFKEVNDVLGHSVGDALLREIADRLRRWAPERATAVRLGGDEFAVLLPSPPEQARVELDALVAAVFAPVAIAGVTLSVSAAIGLVGYPEHGNDPDLLVQRADIAMYAAKAQRGNAIVPFNLQAGDTSRRRLQLAADLDAAVAGGRLSLVYQPQARVCDGAITGVEALVRWHHPTLGPVAPDEFIGIAENTGTIRGLTRWVLATAVAQARAWRDAGIELEIAINVSAMNLLEPDLVDHVAHTLAEHGQDGRAITVEVTETQVMADADAMLEALQRLAALGIGIAIDDFGTGYSSLAYLKNLPVEKLKIDKSFVLDLAGNEDDQKIVATVVGLARNLGLAVVAEGVEDRRSWDILDALGCTYAQGYFLSRPIPAEAISEWLGRRSDVAAA
jgi:diguanylate cyclase (GGDEF)-like protein